MPKPEKEKPRAFEDLITSKEESADMAFGESVIVTARWILVAAGLLLALWLPGPIEQLRVQIIVLLLLAVANFYLHAQLLRHRPAIDVVAYAASAADLAVITLLVASQGGFSSDLFIFYFPALLAISVAFPTVMTLGYAAIVIATYGLVAMGTAGSSAAEVVLTRLLMLAAVAVCGNMYWRIERGRRAAAAEAQGVLAADIRAR